MLLLSGKNFKRSAHAVELITSSVAAKFLTKACTPDTRQMHNVKKRACYRGVYHQVRSLAKQPHTHFFRWMNKFSREDLSAISIFMYIHAQSSMRAFFLCTETHNRINCMQFCVLGAAIQLFHVNNKSDAGGGKLLREIAARRDAVETPTRIVFLPSRARNANP